LICFFKEDKNKSLVPDHKILTEHIQLYRYEFPINIDKVRIYSIKAVTLNKQESRGIILHIIQISFRGEDFHIILLTVVSFLRKLSQPLLFSL
jgi:hypothetical protein